MNQKMAKEHLMHTVRNLPISRADQLLVEEKVDQLIASITETEEDLLSIAQSVLRSWNGGSGFMKDYFKSSKGQFILSNLKKTLQKIRGSDAQDSSG